MERAASRRGTAGTTVTLASLLLAALPAPLWAAEAFLEQDGQVVIEAEHYDDIISRSGRSWVLATSLSGFSGDGYMTGHPSNGTRWATDYVNQAPELVYNVHFTIPGTYYVWVRSYKTSWKDNTIHAGLDGIGVSTADAIGQWVNAAWAWENSTHYYSSWGDRFARVTVSSPGLHTIHLWMFADGFRADKILLRTDSAYVHPSGIGPPESPRVTIGADTTAPQISAIAASSDLPTETTITWVTDEDATSQVEYGPTADYGQQTTLDATLVTSHAAILSGLSSEATYHFRVRSEDAAGNPAVSGDLTFTTAPPADATPPNGSVLINGGAVATNTPSVVLTLSAADDAGLVTEMQLSADGTSYDPPEPFATGKTWTLGPGDGVKTVYVRFSDEAGNWSDPVNASITLDTTPPVISIMSPLDGAVITTP